MKAHDSKSLVEDIIVSLACLYLYVWVPGEGAQAG
jgi:hypothetical protein